MLCPELEQAETTSCSPLRWWGSLPAPNLGLGTARTCLFRGLGWPGRPGPPAVPGLQLSAVLKAEHLSGDHYCATCRGAGAAVGVTCEEEEGTHILRWKLRGAEDTRKSQEPFPVSEEPLGISLCAPGPLCSSPAPSGVPWSGPGQATEDKGCLCSSSFTSWAGLVEPDTADASRDRPRDLRRETVGGR